MNFQKLPIIIGYNVVLAIADIILLSSGLSSLSGTVKLLIILISLVLFIAGNYLLLSMAFKKPVIKNKANAGIGDFENVFKGWKGMNTPFPGQIEIALKQLEQLKSRKNKLAVLSDDTTFDSAVEEVESNMFANFNRIINRLVIYDKADSADVNRSLAYINSALATNAKYLDVLRKFIDEISMLGDSGDSGNRTLSLQTITESLRELRTSGDFTDDQF